jgi:hypothetical protein
MSAFAHLRHLSDVLRSTRAAKASTDLENFGIGIRLGFRLAPRSWATVPIMGRRSIGPTGDGIGQFVDGKLGRRRTQIALGAFAVFVAFMLCVAFA